MKFFDLSFRYKIPLWGSMLIIVTAIAVSASMIVDTYDELKEDLIIDSDTLARSLTSNLFPALLHDDTWRAFEIISTAIDSPYSDWPGQAQAEAILVVDNALNIVVSTHPKMAPISTDISELSPEYAALADQISQMGEHPSQAIELPGSNRFYYITPISRGNAHLGTLIIVYPQGVFMPRFFDIAWHGLSVGSFILAILLPLNWYWGRRMTLPLLLLASRMSKTSGKWPADLEPDLYTHRDELGQLFEAYHLMLEELKAKESLEKQMEQSERLAALGQLAAGIAHEVNNPLGGMLTAIDTLKRHGNVDPRTMKTIALLERGLTQIRDTVGALLVEAKLKSRNLLPQDIEDVQTLITPLANKKAIYITWHNSLDGDIPLPATLVRQILINLLLNAVQAATQQGEVLFDIHVMDGNLRVVVENNGKTLSPEQISHLFEPFSPLSRDGHGLGLWVTYQIVHQLGGHVEVEKESNDYMRFTVEIPMGGAL
ncbi:MAG TPA: HAMP domain-containing sensor histidine kinase [Sulfuricella sp.]|nr:HAMP domain-containing sensor histidine kinase [Sulfuricella sp.]